MKSSGGGVDGVEGVKIYKCILVSVSGWQYPSIYPSDHPPDVISALAPLPANPAVIMNPGSKCDPHWSISSPPSLSTSLFLA